MVTGRSPAAPLPPPQDVPHSDQRVNELLVRFRPSVSEQEKNALLQWTGASRLPLRGASNLERLSLTDGQSIDAITASLGNSPQVELVEPNYLIRADEVTPNDPRFDEQWALRNTGQGGASAGSDIGVTQAWVQTTGSARTVIAVIDSGVDFTHPDLQANEWANPVPSAQVPGATPNFASDLHGWDFVTDSNESKDEQGHGTAVAGLIAARGNNRMGSTGVMWRASLMSLRVLDNTGTGDVAHAVEAIDYAVAHGAQVINCSWGFGHESKALGDAIARAASHNVLFVCAAGNGGHDLGVAPHYPASYELPNMVAVAATDEFGQLLSSSNYGGGQQGVLAAPGRNLLSTKAGGDYATVSGTSMATALVAGVVGLIKTLRPSLSAELVRAMLTQGAQTMSGGSSAISSVSAASALTALDTLPPNEGHDRMISGDHPANTEHANARRVAPLHPVDDLPNLNQLRRQPRYEPHAPAHVRSRLRRRRAGRRGESGSGVISMLVPSVERDGANESEGSLLSAKYTDPTAPALLAANLPTASHDGLLSLFDRLDDGTFGRTSDAPTHIGWAPQSVQRNQAVPAKIVLRPAQTLNDVVERLGAFNRLMLHGMLAAASPNDATFVSQTVPTQLVAGQQYAVTVRMQNTGATTWTAGNSYRLGTQSTQDNQLWTGSSRVLLPNSVAPNAVAEFSFTITAPDTPGAYAFQWRMVQDGVEWFGQTSPLNYISVTSNAHFVSQQILNAQNQSALPALHTGAIYTASVTMQNTGRSIWPVGSTIKLGSRSPQDNNNWGTSRVALPYDVAPGAYVTFNFNITAPAASGVYNFQWEMVQDGFAWFGDFTQNLALNVTADGSYTPAAADNVLISEFRLRGPAGPADEFIELYNNTSAPLAISTQDNTAGWTLAKVAADGTTSAVCVIPAGTVIPARGHYLIANATAYSLTAYAAPDLTYTTGTGQDIADNSGSALFRTADTNSLSLTTRLDAVGFTSVANNPYVEGTGLAPITSSVATTDGQFSFVRKLNTGTPQDTDNNAADFALISTTACVGTAPCSPTAVPVQSAALGAPGPESLGSPIQYNGTIPASYIDNGVCATCGINRVRDYTPVPNGTLGTLIFRRKFTNNTGSPSTRLRFRVVDVTTKNFNQFGYASPADMRLLSSADVTVTNSANQPVLVRGTTLDAPSAQNMGGGFNSTAGAGAITLGTPLAAGDSVNVQFVMGLMQGGSFRFFVNVEAALGAGAGQPAAPPTADDFASARLSPANRTGGAGVDLRSGNYNWSLPLVSLPGRAGLDLGLALVYNSRVWTRSGNFITFDADQSFPSPGFRLGFPVIQPKYYNSMVQKYAYLLLTPAGDHVELRQTATPGVYEAADSSYLQLTEGSNGLTLRPPDGAQLSFGWANGVYQCTQVEDRNGNLISVAYDGLGQPLSITDTLGRVVNFVYDSYDNLIQITQQWNGATHVWASFGWGTQTVQTNFQSTVNGQSVNMTMVGLENGSTIPVLNQVGLADGSLYRFDYTSWAQVNRITRYTLSSDSPPQNPSFPVDYTARSYTAYFLYFDNGAHDDCPRVLYRNEWAQYWNGGAEAGTAYSNPQDTSWTMPDNTTQNGILLQVTTADGTSYKNFMHSAGWDDGLPLLVETWANNAKQRWVTTAWTQDDTTKAFPLNPRATQVSIYDANGNYKHSETDYTAYGLPVEVREYDGGTALRRAHTDYRLDATADAAYLNRRLLGLVKEQAVYGQDPATNQERLYAKTTYDYDQTGECLVEQGAATQHDASYSDSFSTRGNVTAMHKWDVSQSNVSLTSTMGYNTNGSAVFARDPLGNANRQVTLSYTDAFVDQASAPNAYNPFAPNTASTFAYPTTITDPDGYKSFGKYDYSFGALRQQQTPPANSAATTDYSGPQQTTAYDAAGRAILATNSVTAAQVQVVYPASLMTGQTLSSFQAGGAAAAASQVFDGAGRVRATAKDFIVQAGGTATLHYSAQKFVFDQVGQLVNQANPTEGRATGHRRATTRKPAGCTARRRMTGRAARP